MCRYTHAPHAPPSSVSPAVDHLDTDINKLSYRRGTARRAMTVEILSTVAQREPCIEVYWIEPN